MTKKTGHFEGDAERAAKHKRAQSNVPVEVDPETTPPPSEPPPIESIEGFEDISPPIREALITIHNTQREQDVAITRIWDARHMTAELAAMKDGTAAVLDRLNRLSGLPPLVQQQSAGLVQLLAWKDSCEKRDRRMESTLDAIDKRLDTVEREYLLLNQNFTVLAREISAGRAEQKKSIEDLEREIEELKKDHSGRIRSLEDTRTSAKAQLGAIAAIAAVIATVASWFLSKVMK